MKEYLRDFVVRFNLDGKWYVFNGKSIRWSTTDGGGTPILSAVCFDAEGNRGVVNLTHDWQIKSLYME